MDEVKSVFKGGVCLPAMIGGLLSGGAVVMQSLKTKKVPLAGILATIVYVLLLQSLCNNKYDALVWLAVLLGPALVVMLQDQFDKITPAGL